MHSIIKNPDKYFSLLNDLLCGHDMISDPKQLFGLIEISKHKNKTVGWQINNKEIKFKTEDFLDCDEAALQNGDRFVFKYFSYHFNPAAKDILKSYRIDLDKTGELHMNPDESLENNYGHYIKPEQLYFDINNFNCALAILLALLYMDQNIYPAEPQAVKYGKSLQDIRRKLT